MKIDLLYVRRSSPRFCSFSHQSLYSLLLLLQASSCATARAIHADVVVFFVPLLLCSFHFLALADSTGSNARG